MRETEQLAEYIVGLKYEDLPEDVIATAMMAIKDIVGVSLFASQMPWSQKVAELSVAVGGGGASSIWGRPERVSPSYAALANATAAHGIEMDDLAIGLSLHNGAPTVAAAIALAEHIGAKGHDVVLAVVCGYEVGFRVARATPHTFPRFHADSLRVFYGPVAAAAKLLGLDVEATINAYGLAGNLAGGLYEWHEDQHGSMSKRFQGGGWPSATTINAALLAKSGLTASSTTLEGEHGFCNTYCIDVVPDIEAITRGLGESFEMRLWETKAYASRGSYNSAIDGLAKLRREHEIDLADVDFIEVNYRTRITDMAGGPTPTSTMTAQYHLPFVLATSLYHDVRNPAAWSEDVVDDPEILDIFSRIRMVATDELQENFLTTGVSTASRVTIGMNSGEQFTTLVQHGLGSRENKFKADDVDGKFRLLGSAVLDDASLDELGRGLEDFVNDAEMPNFGISNKLEVTENA